MNYDNTDLMELIERARRGGDQEYHDLMKHLYNGLIAMAKTDVECKRQVRFHYETTEEAVSDNILHVMDNLINRFDENKGKLPMTYAIDGLKFRIFTTHSNDYRRKGQKKYPLFIAAIDDMYNRPDWYDEINDAEDREHRLYVTMKAIRTLPLKQQDALEGHMAGKTLRETSAEMGLTYQRVHQILNDAVNSIKQILRSEFE